MLELQDAARDRVTEMMVLSVTQAHGPSCALCLFGHSLAYGSGRAGRAAGQLTSVGARLRADQEAFS